MEPLHNVAQATIMMVGVLVIVLTGLVLYLILLLTRVEQTLWRMRKLMRPEVLRGRDGKPLYERN